MENPIAPIFSLPTTSTIPQAIHAWRIYEFDQGYQVYLETQNAAKNRRQYATSFLSLIDAINFTLHLNQYFISREKIRGK